MKQVADGAAATWLAILNWNDLLDDLMLGVFEYSMRPWAAIMNPIEQFPLISYFARNTSEWTGKVRLLPLPKDVTSSLNSRYI